MNRFFRCSVAFLLLIPLNAVQALSGAVGPDGGLVPTALRTEYRTNPLGVDAQEPRLSWVLQPARPDLRGQRQTAYRVLAASTPERLAEGEADGWDSGKVQSDATLHVVYAGRPLRSGERVYWTVQVWDENDRPSAPSEPAWWEMGLLEVSDWEGMWIKGMRSTPQTDEAWYDDQPVPLLRKNFSVQEKEIARARIYVTGLGYYELHLNGERVGDHVLDPAWTHYGKRVFYSVYDVTDRVRCGENVLGLMLGNGWYNPLPLEIFNRWQLRETLPVGDPKAILQLNIEYADGTSKSIFTDTSWQAGDGPILKNNIYLGEIYDARREQPGWDRAGFDDASWKSAQRTDSPGGRLIAQDVPPIRVKRTIQAVDVIERAPGVYLFDMGENFAGWVTLRVEGARGDTVRMRFGERLHETGDLDVLTSAMTQIKNWGAVMRRDWEAVLGGRFWDQGPYRPETAWQADTYILKGEGVETYTPRFTWHGFRYVEVRGFPGVPTFESLVGHALHSDVEPAGSFASSNALFNQIQEVTMRTMLSNLFSVQSDCPHRERFGYGGDIVAASEMGLLNLDMARFYAKTVDDFADAMQPVRGFTPIAPDVGIGSEPDAVGADNVDWGTAHPMLVWQLYQYYGDVRVMEEEYDRVRRWVAFLSEHAVDDILNFGIGDHETLAPKAWKVSGTAYYFYNTDLLARMAQVLGRASDAAQVAEQAAGIKEAFNRHLLHQSGAYETGTQAAQAFALYFDLVPEDRRPDVLRHLVRDIENHARHLSTGILGTKYLFEVLTRHGRTDLAYAIANQRTFPSFGYMLDNGATTLWESWVEPEQASHNHPMFGSVSEWFYKAILGIRPAENAVGFDRITLRPWVGGDMKWAKGHYDSVRGRIESSWLVVGDRLVYEVTVPVGVTATVVLPALSRQYVTEGNLPADRASGLRFLREEAGAVSYEAGSGRYRFVVEGVVRA